MAITLIVLTERLAEAQAAYHMLMTGKGVVEVRDSSGESIRYTQGNLSRLRLYILELEALIAGLSPARGPMRPVFGI